MINQITEWKRQLSKSHTNRRSYNWLLYDISDIFLEKHEVPYNFYRLASGLCGQLNLTIKLARLIRRPWPIRKFMTLLVRMIWAIDQRVAHMLDKYWKCEEETAGYFVVAKKA